MATQSTVQTVSIKKHQSKVNVLSVVLGLTQKMYVKQCVSNALRGCSSRLQVNLYVQNAQLDGTKIQLEILNAKSVEEILNMRTKQERYFVVHAQLAITLRVVIS